MPEPSIEPTELNKTVIYLESAEDQLLKQLGVMTCTELKHHLNKTPDLTEEEEVMFIEDNMRDTAALKKFVRELNLTPLQMTYFAKGGKELLKILKEQVYAMFDKTAPDKVDAEEETCKELRDKVDRFYRKKGNISKSRWTAIIDFAKSSIKAAMAMTAQAFSAFWTTLTEVAKVRFIFQWAAAKGFVLWKWITTNPRAAYMALLTLKTAKSKMCSLFGDICNQLGYAPQQNSFLKEYLKKYPLDNGPGLGEFIKDILMPGFKKVIINGSVNIFETASMTGLQYLTGKDSSGNNTGMGIAGAATFGFTIGGPVGALVAGGVSVIAISVATAFLNESKKMGEELVFQTEVNDAYNMFMQVINPMTCLNEMLRKTTQKEAYDTVKKVAYWEYVFQMVKKEAVGYMPREDHAKWSALYENYREYSATIQGQYERGEVADANDALEVLLSKGKDDDHLIYGLVYDLNFKDLKLQVPMFIWALDHVSNIYMLRNAVGPIGVLLEPRNAPTLDASREKMDRLYATFSKHYDAETIASETNMEDAWKLAFNAIETAAREECVDEPLVSMQYTRQFKQIKASQKQFLFKVRIFSAMMRYDPYRDQRKPADNPITDLDNRYKLRKCGIYMLQSLLKNINTQELIAISHPCAYSQPIHGWVRHVVLYFLSDEQFDYMRRYAPEYVSKNIRKLPRPEISVDKKYLSDTISDLMHGVRRYLDYASNNTYANGTIIIDYAFMSRAMMSNLGENNVPYYQLICTGLRTVFNMNPIHKKELRELNEDVPDTEVLRLISQA